MTGSKQQGLTIELSPAEMDALKQLAKDAKCNINGLAKSILVEQIKKRTDAKKPYFAFAAWPGSSIGGHIESRYLDTLDDVRAMVEEVSAKGAKR